jgi:hypothetical protein
MSTGGELVENVSNSIQDSSIEEDRILNLLIEGHRDLNFHCSLPSLIHSQNVTTLLNQNYVALPDTYSHGLFDCIDEVPTNIIRVFDSDAQMRKEYGHLQHVGLVQHVCAIGTYSLRYQPVPEIARDLTLHFYRNPIPITEGATPEGLLPHQHKILEHYALWRIWDDIEDGIEGRQVNTKKFEKYYLTGRASIGGRTSHGRAYPNPPISSGIFI